MAVTLAPTASKISVFVVILSSIIFIVILIDYLPNYPTQILEQVKISMDDIDDIDDIGNKYSISLIESMINSETNTTTICDPNKYKYIKLLLKDLEESNLNKYRLKTTSKEIEKDYLFWRQKCWKRRGNGYKSNDCYFWKKKVRIQIINNSIFVSSTKYEMERHIYDKEGYRTGLFFYLCSLQRKYGKYLPNTDLIWYYHDFKSHLNKNNWKINGNIPYFFTDYNLAHVSTSNLLLFSISRAYLKYKYFAGKEESFKLINQYNYRRIADYLEWLNVLKQLNETNKMDLLTFNGKKINKAVFRGANNAKYRNKIYETLINNTYFNLLFSDYFDIAMTNPYAIAARDGPLNQKNLTLSLIQQLQYKYIIVLDGVSVRDSLMYQMKMGSVILKQLTTNYEWWYFDVINGFHWILFENVSHLISIVINLVNQIEGYYKSTEINGVLSKKEYSYLLHHEMTSYSKDKLQEITENSKQFIAEYFDEKNVDCFMIHMIQIYNKYLFDINSINKSSDEFMRKLPPHLY